MEGYREKVGGIQGKGWRDIGKRLEGYREKGWKGYWEKIGGI